LYYAGNSQQKETNKEQGRKELYYAGNSQQKVTNKEQGMKKLYYAGNGRSAEGDNKVDRVQVYI